MYDYREALKADIKMIMIKLYRKKKAYNKRVAEYIAEKRKTNKNYAR